MQVRRNDKLRLLARGPDADAALAAFQALAADNFGESPAAKPAAAPATPERVEGAALRYPLALIQPLRPAAADAAREQQRLRQAIDQTLADLIALTELAENKFHADIAAIFAGHHTLLDDDDLFDAANDRLLTEQCTAEWAWHQVLMELSQQYRQLDDPYLQARYIDIEDILQRTLRHLQGVQERVPTPGEPTIIIADNIYPSTVLQLDASFVKGLCLRDGSEQAHGAIIARAAGIAWLSQQGEALEPACSLARLSCSICATSALSVTKIHVDRYRSGACLRRVSFRLLFRNHYVSILFLTSAPASSTM